MEWLDHAIFVPQLKVRAGDVLLIDIEQARYRIHKSGHDSAHTPGSNKSTVVA